MRKLEIFPKKESEWKYTAKTMCILPQKIFNENVQKKKNRKLLSENFKELHQTKI